MTVIKICGLTSIEDALGAAESEADIIGMVFAPSRRRVSPDQAFNIVKQIRRLPDHPIVAGVFVNEAPQSVNEIAAYCGLDIVQLSGDESWDYCRKLACPFIKVIHITPASNSAEIVLCIKKGYASSQGMSFICMLDCKFDGNYGGSGFNFDWDVATEATLRFPLMIAGGLSAGNVRKLIRQANPAGVDVSSGVEIEGKKDIGKIQEFIRAVRLTGGRSSKDYVLLKKLLREGGKYVTR